MNENEGANFIPVRSVSEEYQVLGGTRCACGGPLKMEMQAQIRVQGAPEYYIYDRLHVRCEKCGTDSSMDFQVDTRTPEYQAEGDDLLKDLGIFD